MLINNGHFLWKKTPFILAIALSTQLVTGCGSSEQNDSDDVTITNTAPIADAGANQTLTSSALVTLDASASSDADGDSLSYQWQFDSIPSQSSATLSDSSSEFPTFTPDIDGDYIVSLAVSDGSVQSVADDVTITLSSTTSSSRSYAIVDTNQSSCYNATSGDTEACTGGGTDADYSGNQPDYTLSEDGLTVSDNVTGLTWTQSSDINDDGVVNYDDKLYQSEAVTYCNNLSLSGRDDWRLPNVKEAFSLILFSGKDPSNYTGTDTSTLTLFLDETFDRAFGDLDSGIDRIIDGQYASTSIYVSTTMNGNDTMFGVNYVDGRIKGYPTETKEYYVRCVADNTEYGINDFVDNEDFTISDNATGLMWQQNDTDSSNWEDAIEQCETATTADYSDWRLPNIKELHSLVDYTRSPDTSSSAAISSLFNSTSFSNEEGETDWGYYWASTTHVDNSGNGSNATYVSFGRALGYMNETIMDVHGAGSQRSNDKLDVSSETGASSATEDNGEFYYKGPQGDILRANNKVRCVRDISVQDNDESDEQNSEETQSYTLFTPIGSMETYLIDEQGETVHIWESSYRPALSVYLLESGELLRTGILSDKPDTFSEQVGGAGGIIEILDDQSEVVWTTTLATEEYLSHHDIEVLPNGNILAVVWEAKSAEEALALGRSDVADETLWAGAVYEICRASENNTCSDGEIVWQWRVWDHIVQDIDSSISDTYVSDVNDHQDKIDINYYSGSANSDWTHINSVDYHEETDQILVSVRSFSEYWIIDHSDSTKGIISRVGNPAAYGGTGEQLLFSQHDAQWIEGSSNSAGNITVFNNGSDRTDGDYSSVDEFCHLGNDCNAGELVSSYSEGASGDFYADHISGAQRLSDGNTLVCSGTSGYLFEFNESHEVVWEFDYDGNIFKATRYLSDYAGFSDWDFNDGLL